MIFFLLRFFYYHLQQFHSQSAFCCYPAPELLWKIFCILYTFRRILKNFFEDPVCIYKKIFPISAFDYVLLAPDRYDAE